MLGNGAGTNMTGIRAGGSPDGGAGNSQTNTEEWTVSLANKTITVS